MRQYLSSFLFLVLFSGTLTAQSNVSEIERSLYALPDVVFSRVTSGTVDVPVYELHIKQLVDHNNPEAGYFWQRAFLTHRGFDRPTVMCTEGYNRPRNRSYELTELLQANQIDIEHRYFGSSVPDTMDYRYLNLEQATADLHHINQLFRNVYSGKWVSTGISKGGSTTIFYRYFYPEDVDVSVPYVAPINTTYEDPRLYYFLDTIGSDACRAAILDFQRRMLKERDEVLPLLEFYGLGAGYEFTYHSPEAAFELAVLEYPFSFWQYGHDCGEIPDKSTSLTEALKYLLKVSDIGFFSDAPTIGYASHYYQAATEMGYYGYETDDFRKLLKAVPLEPYPHAAFMPDKMEVPFDGALLEAVNEWLPVNGDGFIYINGALDTWSATAVPPNEQSDALWFFLEGKHHGNARIKYMTDAQQRELMTTLERWLDMEIDPANLPTEE